MGGEREKIVIVRSAGMDDDYRSARENRPIGLPLVDGLDARRGPALGASLEMPALGCQPWDAGFGMIRR